ncbi:hypothetical protein OJAV_G00220250 [Oryzias javanicus]|uniref:Uncharacterized protein n=1 Tax=Oryzias javanicus TaxID=123683 RepID=A0A3S2PN82_ORYJA|nr:hypothetical protein OJAV_G00220250 [Oryzias javanicus]
MDQCENTQEGDPPSKNTLCEEDESQSKAQRSDDSEDYLTAFKNSRSRIKQIHQSLQTGSGSEPSCVSFRSDCSKNKIIDFKSAASSSAER